MSESSDRWRLAGRQFFNLTVVPLLVAVVFAGAAWLAVSLRLI